MEKNKSDRVERRNEQPYFICKDCLEIITKPENYSKEPEMCIYCYKENEAIKNNKCLECGGKNPKKEFWGCCEKCFLKTPTDKK